MSDCTLTLSAVYHPHFKGLWYPLDKKDNTVDFAILYTEVYENGFHYSPPVTQMRFVRGMNPDENTDLCASVAESLSLKHLDWSYFGGRCLLNIHQDDLTKVYSVIDAFLERGYRIYCNDSTQVTFT